jgi:phosphoribosyl 1,2-cyclic phosphate phosphodiesterase
MKITYLGTGAAERVPAIFCNCGVCRYAKKHAGRDIRTQSQTLIDDGDLLIDFPGDSYLHSLNQRIAFHELEHLLITHWHADHFYAEDLAYRMRGYASNLDNKLHVYGSKYVKQFYDRAFELEGVTDLTRIEYHVLKPFKMYTIHHYLVYPFPARHGLFKEDCYIYAIQDQRTKKAILYMHDSGMLLTSDLARIAVLGIVFDIVSLDCTGQNVAFDFGTSHMTFKQNLAVIAALKAGNLVHEDTVYVANHFSHNGGLNYLEMAALSKENGVITSYDGLIVEV